MARSVASSAGAGAPAILLVDDKPANLVALQAVLEPLQVPMLLAKSGEEALAHLLRSEVSCILLDVQMPGLDGFETARLIRERERTRYIPIIFVTAVSREEAHIVRGYSEGAVDYVVKPFDPDILRSKVRVFVDLERQKSALREQDARLQRSQLVHAVDVERQQLRDLFRQAPVAVCILEGRGHVFTFANPAYLELVGQREVVGKPLLEALPELRGRGFDALLDKVVASGEPFVGREVPVQLLHHAPGEVAYMNFVYQPKRGLDGQVTGVLCCAFEVTDQVLARKKAEALAEALGGAVQVREDILAVVSHDLKNPIGAIDISTALLNRHPLASDEAARRQLDTISRSTHRMVRLIGDLLDMSSIQAGRLSVETRPTSARDLVAEAIDANEPHAREQGVELRADLHVSDERVLCDHGRVLQVFSNLLGNAIKFCRRGDRVTVAVEPVGDLLEFSVSDTGPGIPPEELPHLFQAYWSAPRNAKKGTGLGLFIARGIVEAHGGTLRAESPSGAGSTFRFTLPRSIGSAPAVDAGGLR